MEETQAKPPQRHRLNKKFFIFGGGLIIVALAILISVLNQSTPSPVPASIKSQVKFAIIYPNGFQYDGNSWQYSNQSLSFTAHNNGLAIAFQEQQVPLAFQNDQAAYERFIGSLKPQANFSSPLGTVSVVNFITSNDFQPEGEAGVLNAKGTLMFAHPNVGATQAVSDNEWRTIFNSLKVAD